MPDHRRKAIRVEAATALGGLPTTGTNVFRSRLEDIPEANVPALRVYTQNEEVRGKTLGANAILDRLLELVVEGVAKQNSGLDDTLDAIALEVEAALANNQQVGEAKSITLSRTEIDMDAEADKDRGVVRMTFIVNYWAAQDSPDIAF